MRMLDPSQYRILNGAGETVVGLTESKVDPVELSQSLHKGILRLKGLYMSKDGSKVDYAKLRTDSRFREFEKETHLLMLVDLAPLNEQERKAFFINVYNTLTIHALAVGVESENTVLELEKFWQKNAYRIGEHAFSLDDIEHGVLRGNKLHPTHKDYFFRENDPRRAFVQTVVDPRIHFALNCGAKSCPPIRLFSAENLDMALDLVTRTFCQSEITIDTDKKTVKMPKILMWYDTDFGSDQKSILLWLCNYMSGEQEAALRKIIDDSPTIQYSEYNWEIC